MGRKKQINLYDYLDYRQYLKDKIKECALLTRGFSYRQLNKKMGIKSSAFLSLVMDGKRDLGSVGIDAICKGFEFNEKQILYFGHLVKFNQAKNHEEKDCALKKLKALNLRPAKKLELSQYEVFSYWYYIAILELIRSKKIKEDQADVIGHLLSPKVEEQKISKALHTLKNLGMIEADADGYLVRKDISLTTPDEFRSVALTSFHKQLCQLASTKISTAKSEDREFSALTITVNESEFQWIKQELQAMRKRLDDYIECNRLGQDLTQGAYSVAHVNLQLFKLM